MISLNDYLYSGDTVVKILHRYSKDLKDSAIEKGNGVDLTQRKYDSFSILFIDLIGGGYVTL